MYLGCFCGDFSCFLPCFPGLWVSFSFPQFIIVPQGGFGFPFPFLFLSFPIDYLFIVLLFYKNYFISITNCMFCPFSRIG